MRHGFPPYPDPQPALAATPTPAWSRRRDRISFPNTPDYIQGVTNLRGTVVPIVDLRVRFKTAVAKYSSRTVVIVLKVHADGQERTVGFIVDAVSDVQNISPEDVKETPDLGSGIGT